MKITSLSLIAATALALTAAANAAPKTYQVTGPVLEVSDSMITVQKGNERWEIARESSTKAPAALKVGDKVTIKYSMTATEIEMKEKGAEGRASASPGDSSKKK